MALNEKQQRFIEEYLIDLNATQAAIRAGYSEKTAYSQGQRLLKHVEVAAEIQKGKQQTSTELSITKEWVIRQLHAEATGLSDSNAKSRISALKLLAQMCGHLVEKRSVEHTGAVQHKHELSPGLKAKMDAVYESNAGD